MNFPFNSGIKFSVTREEAFPVTWYDKYPQYIPKCHLHLPKVILNAWRFSAEALRYTFRHVTIAAGSQSYKLKIIQKTLKIQDSFVLTEEVSSSITSMPNVRSKQSRRRTWMSLWKLIIRLIPRNHGLLLSKETEQWRQGFQPSSHAVHELRENKLGQKKEFSCFTDSVLWYCLFSTGMLRPACLVSFIHLTSCCNRKYKPTQPTSNLFITVCLSLQFLLMKFCAFQL